MLNFRLPPAVLRMNIRVGTKLAITVGIGIVLVGIMIVNQQFSNASVTEQAELERAEQVVTADILRAGVALQRMQTGTREIRLAISEREADEALANLRSSMSNAVSLLQAAIRICTDAENRERFEKLDTLAKAYSDSAGEIVTLKKSYSEITRPLEKVTRIGAKIDALIEKATSVATTLASRRMVTVAAQMSEAAKINMGFGFFVVVILMGAAVFGVLSIGRPIREIADVLLQLANGKREFAIPYTKRGDEVGDAARAASTFRDNLVRLEKFEAEQKETAERVMAERKAMVRDLADMFENAIGNIVGAVSSAANEMESTAGVLAKNAEATRQLSGDVAVASTQASTNAQSAAFATGEVGASIEEIGRQVQQSTAIAAEAVKQAEKTDAQITELSNSASRIGEVVTLITTIAGQTNLLALNATIEAARAGEAGRGFAVVASEVKTLATQTANATEAIKTQIDEMQAATRESVAAIKDISNTIGRISEIAGLIAAAVNEQGKATQEIAHNVAQAARGAVQVATNIAEVNQGAGETGAASAKVLQAAKFLSGESRKLEQEVENFLNTVRAA